MRAPGASTHARRRESPFDRRLMAVLGGFAFVCFAWAFQVALTSPAESRHADGDDVYGRGPFGFRGLMETLSALDVPVRVNRRPLSTLDDADFLLLTLPMLDTEARRSLRAVLDDGPVGDALLVLPKWRRVEVPAALAEAADASPVRALELGELNTLLRDLGFEAEVAARPPGAGEPARFPDDAALGAFDVDLRAPRGLVATAAADEASPPLCLLETPAGCLALQFLRHGRVTTLLVDPDLLDNHGLVHAQHGPLAVALLDRLRGDAPVVFEATLHGYTVPELWASLLRPPLVYPLLHFALLAGVWALAGSGRFGAARPVAPTLGAGRQVLVENTVELLYRGGHSAHMLVRYWQATVRDLCRLHRVAGDEHATRVRALGLALRRHDELAAVEADVHSAAERRLDPRAIARLTHRIHALRGPRGRRADAAVPPESLPPTTPGRPEREA